METLDHTFPIPEAEAHKLDELTELPSRTRAYVTDNAWMVVALSAVAGCLLGYLWPRRSDR